MDQPCPLGTVIGIPEDAGHSADLVAAGESGLFLALTLQNLNLLCLRTSFKCISI
jgi:hypothetical protein